MNRDYVKKYKKTLVLNDHDVQSVPKT